MGIIFSEEQNNVINLRNRNILVSAAAGSGKTTVLVERIIRMISDEEQPVDIDHLLIVTFTKAAAASMLNPSQELLISKISMFNLSQQFFIVSNPIPQMKHIEANIKDVLNKFSPM